MKKWVLPGLVLLALVQMAVLGVGYLSAELRFSRWLEPGDLISDIQVTDSEDAVGLLAEGEPTLVMVFNSACPHCRRVAPVWKSWLDQHGAEVRAVALSTESYGLARAYAAEHAWDVDVRTLQEPGLATREHSLIARSPRLYAIGVDGTVLAEGSGDDIERVGGVVLLAAEAVTQSP